MSEKKKTEKTEEETQEEQPEKTYKEAPDTRLTFEGTVTEVGLAGLVVHVLDEHKLWEAKRRYEHKKVKVWLE